MDNFKEELKAAYDADAKRRDANDGNRDDWKLKARGYFADLLIDEHRKTVLEIGAGVGLDAKYFQERGFDIYAVDLSPQMVSACIAKGIPAETLDLYELDKLGRQFDGIYSMNVLLHVPRNDLPLVLANIANQLTDGGLFYLGVYYMGTEEEKTFTDKSKMGMPRFFSFLSDETLSEYVKEYFDIVSFEKIDFGASDPKMYFQSVMLRRK